MGHVITSLLRLKDCLDVIHSRFARWAKPLGTSSTLATLYDLGRSKSQLLTENALLRQQLIILNRQVKRPTFTRTDLFFRPLFAFFLVELQSRKVIHVGVTRSPTDAWVAQQLREATPYGQAPKYLIRDNDGKFGSCFARVARTSNIKILMSTKVP